MEPYVFHSDGKSTFGVRVTVVGEVVDGELKLSASRCSEKDAFVKKVGREKAIERLSVGNLVTSIKVEKANLNLFINTAKAVADSVAKHGVYKKIELIDNSKLYVDTIFGFSAGDKESYSYILVD